MSSALSIRAVPSGPPPASIRRRQYGDPCTMVLFGATGDLARKKLFLSVFDLEKKRLLHKNFQLLGVDRTPMSDSTFREMIRESLYQSSDKKFIDEDTWHNLRNRVHYVAADLTHPEGYAAIGERLTALETTDNEGESNRLFYFAVPPFLFEPIVTNLRASGLAPRVEDPNAKPWRRLVVEKPFGQNLKTALALNTLVLEAFAEHQVYRIDHYLGKETVQNMLVFRSANAIFEPLWNRQHISHVQITAAEDVGVEGRGQYYDGAGVVRDMFQNHLLQLLALTAMELPTTLSPNDVRDEKVKVLRALRPLVIGDRVNAVRAQYAPGVVRGKAVAGYRDEPHVKPASATPTYAALRVLIDNGRWRGVPFYLRSGKRMAKRVTEIAVTFHVPPYLMEGVVGLAPGRQGLAPNVLIFRIQPDEGITLRFEAKVPGTALALSAGSEATSVDMDFTYDDAFGVHLPPAYETLLLDVMLGDATLFTRSDEVSFGWMVTDPLLDYWESNPPEKVDTYAAGTWGPASADALPQQDGFRWREP
ncbi:MAG: glucose-6-phosphate dehydrogenase [Polyangiaceae bacterium]|nr:glucose-6-phosphate dehydrogenase [Polyangiaceae bacterium]